MTPILATKLSLPRLRPNVVIRPRLIERLNEGLYGKLTLIAAPAGFGKTTLVSQWLAGGKRPAAWLSLDERDNDPTRFLMYLVSAVQTIAAHLGEQVLGVLQAPQSPPTEVLLVTLLNDIARLPDPFILVLDDYHLLDTQPIAQVLISLVEHLPAQMHLVIATREDPPLPLARLRVRGHLTELRATDLRFTPAEAAAFLTEVMGLSLSAENVAALERRTEGWIAGLQLAALSLQGHPDPTRFITSFTGSHQYVVDYLMEEVLGQQDARMQAFLLRTSILDRMSGPLCDAVLLTPSVSGQATLEYLEHANLFLVPLDHERRWYRYHHLFAQLLRSRLQQGIASSPGEAQSQVNALHIRASQWYEEQGQVLEAFHHAAAAQDVERAVHLLESKRMPVHFRGAMTTILNWLASLPATELEARPALLVGYASLMLVNGQTVGVEEKLQMAEATLQSPEPDDTTRDLVGQIATARATLALGQYQVDTMLAQSRRALECLHPTNLAFRMTAYWTLGWAYQFQGDRAGARRAFTEALALSQASGSTIFTFMASTGLGAVLEADNQFHLAAQTYQRVLDLVGEMPMPIIYEAHLGLARIFYEWNDLEAAEQHGRQSLYLARQYESSLDRFIPCEVLLARLSLAQGDVAGAATRLSEASQSARQHNFVARIPDVAAVQVLTFLRQGKLVAAARLAEMHDLPLSQARVFLARGDPAAALARLGSLRRQVETKGWEDERLKVMVLQAVALQAQGDTDQAVHLLLEALPLAEPAGFIRLFVDEGAPMVHLLSAAAASGMLPDYLEKLRASCEADMQKSEAPSSLPPPAQQMLEPLSRREREVLQLIAQGLSNQEMSERLVLALETVKGYNKKIFGKLGVGRRTEAVARARELGLL